jgi:hypothetical protein
MPYGHTNNLQVNRMRFPLFLIDKTHWLTLGFKRSCVVPIWAGWLCTLCLLCSPLPALAVTWIWDGEFTTGKSGVQRNIDDPDTSESGARLKSHKHIVFPLPIDRYFEDVDPEEDDDTTPMARHHTSPYSMVTLARHWTYQGQTMPKGIYLAKLGAFNAGSLKTHRVWQPAPAVPPARPWSLPGRLNQQRMGFLTRRPPVPTPPELTLVLTQQGRVMAVLPVVAVTLLTKAERKQLPMGTGWVTYNPQNSEGRVTIRGKRYAFSAQLL